MNPLVADVTREQIKKKVADFRPGDTLRVAVRIIEGDKERVQYFEGVCIARHGRGMDETFIVRRVSYGIGMERIFPLHSPRIESIKVIRQGRARRAKLYYLRDLTGKKARLSETRRKRLVKGSIVDVDLGDPPGETQAEAAASPGEQTPAEETESSTAEAQPEEASATPAEDTGAKAPAEPAEQTPQAEPKAEDPAQDKSGT